MYIRRILREAHGLAKPYAELNLAPFGAKLEFLPKVEHLIVAARIELIVTIHAVAPSGTNHGILL